MKLFLNRFIRFECVDFLLSYIPVFLIIIISLFVIAYIPDSKVAMPIIGVVVIVVYAITMIIAKYIKY
jgi:uncharacterized membrane protein